MHSAVGLSEVSVQNGWALGEQRSVDCLEASYRRFVDIGYVSEKQRLLDLI